MAVDITSAHITASGNISASGYVQAEHFKADIGNGYTIAGTPVLYANAGPEGSALEGGITFVSNEFVNRTKILGNHIELNGVVTASSHISSSGTVSAKSFLLNGTPVGSSTDTFWETGSVAGSIYYVAGPIAVAAFTATTITGSGAAKFDTVNTGQGDNELYDMNQNVLTTSNVQFNHITASGNISASGIITADTLTSNNIVFTPGATSIKIEAPDETTGNIKGADLTIESGNGFGNNHNGGNITFQTGKGSGAGDGGNIILQAGGGIPSGSITISSNNLNIDNIGNITASGNISVGNGTSTLPAISFAADSTTGIYSPAPDNLSLQVGGGTVELNIGAAQAQLSTNLNLSSAANGNITASGDISASGTITGNSIVGTLGTAAQTNITSVGTLSALTVSGDITASGNISASGTIIGSNLSGTNTGDQDLSNLAVTNEDVIFDNITADGFVLATGNIQGANISGTNTGDEDLTPYALISNISGSFVASVDAISIVTGSYAVTGSDVIFNDITASGNISGSLTSTASFGVYIGDGSYLTGIASTIDTGSFAITGSDVIFDDLTTTGQIIAGDDISTSANISAGGNISGSTFYLPTSGKVGNSGTNFTFTDSSLLYTNNSYTAFVINAAGFKWNDINSAAFDFKIGSGTNDHLFFADASEHRVGIGTATPSEMLHVAGNISASGTIYATNFVSQSGGHINAESVTATTVSASQLIVNGTGVPTIYSPTNIILSASNAVVIADSPLRLKSYADASTGSAANAPGDIYFNSDTNKFMGFNGSTHVELG